ncbi:hypothetical protein CI109_105411 [Kwoniella shandongensis]|uniref:Uncharacterized protein n=1 Tax=Kwoniella shandongensis TaxID=1734106 RepID=A0A5M6BQJ3_9TREE|nr:uncharacterized protein CI109_007283 [Kwoniella shandongensis]KAA5524372.1 hypothetical protein CI109_007283 [Kwoniella shandongensis]
MLVKQLLFVLTISHVALAYQRAYAVETCEPSQPCTWMYENTEDPDNPIVANGYCAPDGYCGDDGARCDSEDECYNHCASGICGGEGAACDSDQPFEHGQTTVTCAPDQGLQCNFGEESGTCGPAPPPPQPSGMKKRALRSTYPYKQFKYHPGAKSVKKRAGHHFYK